MPITNTPDGRTHNVTEQEFDVDDEPWIIIRVADGTKLKFRVTITSVARSDQYNERGEPFYLINSANYMQCFINEDLVKKPEKQEPKGYG